MRKLGANLMKKIVPLSLLLGTLTIACVSLLKSKPYQEVLASNYSSIAVPKNLDLNDATDEQIRNYYSGLNSLSESERQGTNLLKNLKPILKNGQTYFAYGSSATTSVWQIYEIVDRDWEKSPASAISGYNASTNTITGYSYGSSNSNKGSNPYLHALYVNRDKENGTRAWGDHSQTNYGHNQEHVWPKSAGFEDETHPIGARGDVMHLWAGNGRVNGQYHSNYYYGNVDKNKTYTDAGDDYEYLRGNLKGYSKTTPGTNYVFEPQDSDKGDIARAIFYMAARYNYLSGSDEDGIDSGNPNLEIVDNISSYQKSGYQSSTTVTGKLGILRDLLEWNKIDPPDEWEIHRNNLCYNNYTHNRNPFIDFPQWADFIWGTYENGTYSASPTGAANPQTDSVNDSGEIKVEEINKPSGKFDVGQVRTLKATTIDNSPITWSVEDPSIVSLDKTSTASGEEVKVTALKNGKTKVIASATVEGKAVSKAYTILVGDNPQDGKDEFDAKAFFEANKVWFIVIGVAAVILIIVLIIVFASMNKKQKKKAKSVVKKAVKKTMKNSSKNSGNKKK